jgi:hypothetical protein
MREGLLTLDAVYQLDLGDEPWTVQILDGAMTLIASSEDWMNITDSNLTPTAAYLQRKLTVEGDIGLAIRFQAMLLWRSQWRLVEGSARTESEEHFGAVDGSQIDSHGRSKARLRPSTVYEPESVESDPLFMHQQRAFTSAPGAELQYGR